MRLLLTFSVAILSSICGTASAIEYQQEWSATVDMSSLTTLVNISVLNSTHLFNDTSNSTIPDNGCANHACPAGALCVRYPSLWVDELPTFDCLCSLEMGTNFSSNLDSYGSTMFEGELREVSNLTSDEKEKLKAPTRKFHWSPQNTCVEAQVDMGDWRSDWIYKAEIPATDGLPTYPTLKNWTLADGETVSDDTKIGYASEMSKTCGRLTGETDCWSGKWFYEDLVSGNAFVFCDRTAKWTTKPSWPFSPIGFQA